MWANVVLTKLKNGSVGAIGTQKQMETQFALESLLPDIIHKIQESNSQTIILEFLDVGDSPAWGL